MPRMNGKQVLEALQGSDGTSKIPVLVMTTVTGIDPSRTRGASDLVEKPFEIDELLDKIALALYRARAGAAEDGDEPVARREAGAEDPAAPPMCGVVLVVHPDHRLIARFDAVRSGYGLPTVSLSRIGDDLPRLARVLEPRAMVVTSDSWTGDEIAVLHRLHAEPMLRAVPIWIVGERTPPADLGEIATNRVSLED